MAVAHVGPWTEEDLLALPADDRRCELLEGALIVNPPPAPRHQGASRALANLLAEAAPEQLYVVEAVGVRVPDGVLVPDVLVADREVALANRSGILDPGPVHLVAEIVSPGSRTMDRFAKPALYARAGIGHYWRVELDEGPTLHAFRLADQGEGYVVEAAGQAGRSLAFDQPFPVSIDPAQLLP